MSADTLVDGEPLGELLGHRYEISAPSRNLLGEVESRADNAATLLPGGQVLVIGGTGAPWWDEGAVGLIDLIEGRRDSVRTALAPLELVERGSTASPAPKPTPTL